MLLTPFLVEWKVQVIYRSMNIISISSSDKLSWPGWLGCSPLWPGHHDIAKLSQLATSLHLAHCLLCNQARYLLFTSLEHITDIWRYSTATRLLRLQQLTESFKA